MKIRDGYLMRSCGGNNTVINVGEEIDFNGMITLNDTGAFFWNLLKDGSTEEELLKKVLSEYDTDEQTAKADISAFLEKLREYNILED